MDNFLFGTAQIATDIAKLEELAALYADDQITAREWMTARNPHRNPHRQSTQNTAARQLHEDRGHLADLSVGFEYLSNSSYTSLGTTPRSGA
ncbi:hypothetical protein [Gordonia sp. CPCC 205333]|uniref:hypothetical protein n=1 Tax=Gordonia sp. CPCC 205333 TaxID=3140790 RepID=UPI003AF3F2CB